MKSLVEVVARRLGISVAEFQEKIDYPYPLPDSKCLEWPGAMSGRDRTTPMLRLNGKLLYIRSALSGRQATTLCGNHRCINPQHLK